MENKKLPDFLIVGTAKAGTTSIAKYLIQNDQVFIPYRKECTFFSGMEGNFKGPKDKWVNEAIIKNIEDYLDLFETAQSNKVTGEASPDYLYFYEKTILNIKKHYQERQQAFPKIIIILRNPIDRAFSHYMHFVRDFVETESFAKALNLEKERKEKNWQWPYQYKEVGLYFDQVKALLSNFDEVLVLFYDDLVKDAHNTMNLINDFIGLRPFNYDLNKKYNESGKPQNEYLGKVLLKIKGTPFIKKVMPSYIYYKAKEKKDKLLLRNLKKMVILSEDKEYLKEYYKEDVGKLSVLLNKDLSHWLK